ncbi:MAG TPA: ABC transporter permease, partial [Chloroflexota bacterium]|nr:ABC transporter permease [Chloroflexota bacterium]
MSPLEDLRYSVRTLSRTPMFSAAVVLTLAIGIGANVAVFSVIDAMLLRGLPYTNPGELIAIAYSAGPDKKPGAIPSPAFLAWSDRTPYALTAYSIGEMGWVLRDGEPVRVPIAFITSNFFDVLGVNGIQRGRALHETDEGIGADPVVVVSDRLWRSRLGGRGDALGQSMRLNGRSYAIVGIAAAGFEFPDSATPDVLVPLTLSRSSPVVRSVNVIGRIRRGESVAEVERELAVVTNEAAGTFPSAMMPYLARGHAEVVPLQRRLVGDVRPVLLMALAAVSVVLLIACANVAGLLLARGTSRDRELWTRIAIGATPARLARLVISETLVLTVASGMATLALFYWSITALRVALARTVPHPEAVGINGHIVAFLIAIIAFTTVVCGLSPVLRMTRSVVSPKSRVTSARFGTDHGIRKWFVAGQVSASFVLLLTGLLLWQTLWRLEAVHVGFDATNVWTFRIPALSLRRPLAETQEAILDRISQMPGVVSVGASSAFPLDGHTFGFTVPVADQPPPPIEEHDATRVDAVSTAYFRTMKIRLIDGRGFDQHDTATAPPVAVVNEAFVRAVLVGPRVLGRRIGLGGGPQDAIIAIVGVVENVKDGNPGDAVPPIVYRPFAQAASQMGWPTADVVVRTMSEPTAIAKSARDAVHDVAPGATIYDEITMEGRFARVVAAQRQRAALFGMFATAAVLLAIVGLYGMLNYSVTRELPEFGIRLALGAQPRNLFAQVLRRGVVPTAIGIAVGILAARFIAILFVRILYGVAPTDPVSYVLSAFV